MDGKGLLVMLGVLSGLVGCESEPLSPAGEGEVWVGVAAEGSSSGPSHSAAGSADAAGSVEVTARVEVWAEGEGWVELTSGAETRTLSRGSGEVSALTTAHLEARTYDRVRVHFEDVRATGGGGVEAGLTIGAGAEVHVDSGSDGATVVEREVELRVRSGAQARLTMNLNVDAWLTEAEGGMVGEAAFASAVQILAE